MQSEDPNVFRTAIKIIAFRDVKHFSADIYLSLTAKYLDSMKLGSLGIELIRNKFTSSSQILVVLVQQRLSCQKKKKTNKFSVKYFIYYIFFSKQP